MRENPVFKVGERVKKVDGDGRVFTIRFIQPIGDQLILCVEDEAGNKPFLVAKDARKEE